MLIKKVELCRGIDSGILKKIGEKLPKLNNYNIIMSYYHKDTKKRKASR
jgi:hypothetical protein